MVAANHPTKEDAMPAPITKLTPKQLIEAAKAPLLAYGEKDWAKVEKSITANFTYDEVATERKVQGVATVIPLWKGWATALPDSKATIHNAYVNGNTVVIELTWNGTHMGPLQLPSGSVAATGKKIALRAINVFKITGETASLQRQYFDMATMLRQLGITG
jgi:steroid delta-isomerase-like uncharacterized protein